MNEIETITQMLNKNLDKLSIKADFTVRQTPSGKSWAIDFKKFSGTLGQWMLVGTVTQMRLREMGIEIIRMSGGPIVQ